MARDKAPVMAKIVPIVLLFVSLFLIYNEFFSNKYTVEWINVETNETEEDVQAYFDTVKISYIDVGQGDCSVIMYDDVCIIIDAGIIGGEEELKGKLRALGVTDVDALILTHPHADHIAAGDDILLNFEVDDLYMPKVFPDTNVFEDVMEAVEATDMEIIAPDVGEMVSYGDIDILFIHPDSDDTFVLTNDYSISTMVYTPFGTALFTGDAEKVAEYDMLDTGIDISADILQVGHHGSITSSMEEFLDAVDPLMAIISCGLDNDYGHPNDEVMDRLYSHAKYVLRTDMEGDIMVRLNENGIFIK